MRLACTPIDWECPSAWATRKGNSGMQWVKVNNDREVTTSGAILVESFSPRAIVRAEAIDRRGSDVPIRQSHDPTTESPGEFKLDFSCRVATVGLRVQLATGQTQGGNEIDAIDGPPQVVCSGLRQRARATPTRRTIHLSPTRKARTNICASNAPLRFVLLGHRSEMLSRTCERSGRELTRVDGSARVL